MNHTYDGLFLSRMGIEDIVESDYVPANRKTITFRTRMQKKRPASLFQTPEYCLSLILVRRFRIPYNIIIRQPASQYPVPPQKSPFIDKRVGGSVRGIPARSLVILTDLNVGQWVWTVGQWMWTVGQRIWVVARVVG